MGITIDRVKARQVLDAAMDLARSGEAVPDTWLARTATIAASPFITLTPVLGTALLAHATDSRVDALALKVESSDAAYSARNLAHGVLVPAAFEYGIDLRTRGPEPLNNQPFFRYDRLDVMKRVRDPEAHRELVSYLREANTLDEEGAFRALAAFLRERLQAAQAAEVVTVGSVGTASITATVAAVDTFLREAAEGGKRAQAFVAAVFDLIYDEVETARVNDPSRHAPGDVHGLYDGRVIAAAEVRAKPVTPSSVTLFIRKAVGWGIPHVLIAALATRQPAIDRPALVDPWRERDILVTIVESAEELLVSALSWNDRPLSLLLARFPERLLTRLADLEVRPESQRRWRDICRASGLTSEEDPLMDGR